MTSPTAHPFAAPWKGALHVVPRIGRRPALAGGPVFTVRGRPGAELALLAAWVVLAGLFLLAVA